MAPEPEVLKRKRSRPSDWWANGSIMVSTPQRIVAPPPQQDKPDPGPAKKRGRRSNLDAPESEALVRDAPAVGNRGRPTKKRQTEADANDENRGPDEVASLKLVRRGRSSGNSQELKIIAGTTGDDSGAGTTKRKRGRKPAGQAKDVEEHAEKSEPLKRRGRPEAMEVEQEETADPEEPAKKHTDAKRRGRPALKESELQSAIEEGGNVIDSKTRGRRPMNEMAAQVPDEQETEVQGNPKKRGRRPVEATTEDIGEPVVATAPKRRSRRSDVNIPSQDPGPSIIEEPERGRPRTRRSDAESQVSESSAAQVSIQEEERGGRRTRLSAVQSQQDLVRNSMGNKKGHDQKTSRKPSTTTNVESASSKLTKAPSRSQRVSRTNSDRAAPEKESRQANQRGKPLGTNAEQRKSSQLSKKTSNQNINAEPSRKRKEVGKPEITPAKRRRRRLSKGARQEDTPVPEPEPEEPSMLYQYLKPITRKVSRQIIEAKWEPLPHACTDKISRLLQDVQQPVVARLDDERKKTQASTALQMVSRRLVSKITKGLPFPPATRGYREEDFDFEKVLDHNRALEAQLTPALHGNELLEAELEKELARLEADKETLAELEKNAKSEASTRSQAARKLHALLQPDKSHVNSTALRDEIGMEDKERHLLPLALGMDDNDLQGLIKGLHGHVDTINGNMNQVHGISEAISKTKAAVQETLFDHLGDIQYEEVIFGSD